MEQQGREIMDLNRLFRHRGTDFTILRFAEMNLSPTGEGDMAPSALRNLDLLLGCFHSALRRADDQTSRYIAALQNSDIQILGHPQTRIYNHREGLQADWRRVFAEAARLDKAVEIDGYPDRQDLRLSLLKMAKRKEQKSHSEPMRTIQIGGGQGHGALELLGARKAGSLRQVPPLQALSAECFAKRAQARI